MTFKATVTPFSSTVGASITVRDERGVAAIVTVIVPDPTRDYHSTADEIIKRLMVGFLSARERLNNIKKGLANETGEITESPPPNPGEDAGMRSSKWDELTPTQQAGILCNEASFQRFLSETRKLVDDSIEATVRVHCLVRSRADIHNGHVSGKLWRALVAAYRVWQVTTGQSAVADAPSATAADAGASVTPVAEAPALTEAEIAHMTERAVYKSILYNAATSDASLRAAWQEIPTKWRNDPELIAVKDRLKAGLA